MQNEITVNQNHIGIGQAISNTFGNISSFIGGLFRLNAKSAAILGSGLILGVLSGVPVIGWACFVFAFVFGAFAASLYIKQSAQAATYSDGLVIGSITGVLGSFVQFILSLVFGLLYLMYSGLSAAAQPKPQNLWATNPALNMLASVGAFGWLMISSLLLFVPIIVLAMLGGLLGVVWFESRVSGFAGDRNFNNQ